MAVTTDPFTGTDLAAFISETWTPIVNEELFAKTVFANFVTDLTPYASESDIFHVPNAFTNSFTVQTQSTQGAEITTESPAQTDTTLTIDTHKYVATLIGDKDAAQLAKIYDYNGVYARKSGRSVADALEDSLAALWSGLSTNSVGDTATSLTDLELRQSIEKLASGNFPLDECAWFFHTYVYWTQIAALVRLYYGGFQATTYATPATMGNFGPMDASRGLQGSIYGIPVFTSTNVVSGLLTYRNLLLHKSCFGFATQQLPNNGGSATPRVQVRADYLLQNLGLLTISSILYGTAELRDAGGVVVNASTTGTVS